MAAVDSGSISQINLRHSKNSATVVAEIPGKDDLFRQLRTIQQQSVNTAPPPRTRRDETVSDGATNEARNVRVSVRRSSAGATHHH